MNDMIQTGFDYAALPVDLAVSLRLHADRFVAVRHRAAYEMGKEIYEAQKELANHDKTQGQFGKWVESLGITRQTGYDLITLYEGIGSDVVKLFDNKKLNQTVAVMLLRAPESVAEKAIEKAESGAKVTVTDVKDWKADYEAERQARELFERRAQESQAESNERRKTIRELETQIDLLKAQPTPEPEKIIVAPDDYETAKAKAAQLETELANLKKEQATLINNQVKAKLHERQAELDKLEQDKQLLDEVVSRKKAYLASIDSDIKRIETHQKVIEENRLHLISLAAFLSDEEPVQDADTRKRWNALADMLAEAMSAVRQYSGDSKPALSVIRGESA